MGELELFEEAAPQVPPAVQALSSLPLLVEGTVTWIVFEVEETGVRILKVTLDSPIPGLPKTIVVKGKFQRVTLNTRIRAEGSWAAHPKFGKQFEARAGGVRILDPKTLIGIERFLSSLVEGIGPGKAAAITRAFGLETLDVLDRFPERLDELVGRELSNRIQLAWKEDRNKTEALVFLEGHEIGYADAAKIWKKYKENTIAVVSNNPYKLSLDVRGIGFQKADKIALSLGVTHASKERYQAALYYQLSQEMQNSGHCFLYATHLIKATKKLVSDEYDMGDCTVDLEDALKELEREKHVVTEVMGKDGIVVYDEAVWRAEKDVAKKLAKLVRAPVLADRGPLHPDRAIEEFEENPESPTRRAPPAVGLIGEGDEAGEVSSLLLAPPQVEPVRLEDSPSPSSHFSLDEVQKEAIRLVATSPVMVLTGGPGTGKTTILKAILHMFARQAFTVELAAPTGRAAKRMQEVTGHPARTIHRLLEVAPPRGDFTRDEDNPIEADAVIIDEASMLDVYMARSLLAAIKPGTRLILVGDVDQLPSVDPGAVLRDILESPEVPSIRLTEIHRQAAGSLIVTNAKRIREGKMPELRKGEPDRDFFIFEESDGKMASDTVRDLVYERIPKKFGFASTDIQVLLPMKKGDAGTFSMNRVLQRVLNPGKREEGGEGEGEAPQAGGALPAGGLERGEALSLAPPQVEPVRLEDSRSSFERRCLSRMINGETMAFYEGDKVIHTHNDYERGVMNGEIGYIRSIKPKDRELIVAFSDPDREVVYSQGRLSDLELAYAMTVHKSQGNEYPVAIVVLLDAHYIMLSRNLLYTAVTRGKKLTIVVGSRRAIQTALSETKKVIRQTRLPARIARELKSL